VVEKLICLVCLIGLVTQVSAANAATSADFNSDGAVDFFDFAKFVSAWRTALGQPDFNDIYDLDGDNNVDINDLARFAQKWLLGAKYPYSPPQTGREKICFNSNWKFYKGTVSGDAASISSYNDSSWLTVNLPHNPPRSGQSGPDPLRPTYPNYSYEGVSWYRKHFNIDSSNEGKKLFVEFEAANTVTDVWINGIYLATHYGGYLPFTVDITDYTNFGQTENVIAVKVNNTDNPDVPIGNSGWFNWGGIYRDTWLHITDKLHVTDAVYAGIVAGGGIFVTYPSVTTAQAQVQVKTHIKNEYPTAKNCTVKSYIVDASNMVVAQMTDTQSIPAGNDYTFTQLTDVTDPCLWHPNHPNLYTVYTEVYEDVTPVDQFQTRIGIRSISFTKAGGFEINGQPFKFSGANRMQDYPYIGYAMGNLGQRRDAEKLKEAGFEYIRTSHYPQDPAFMNTCDELGILVMDAIPGFQYVGGDTFKNYSYQDMRDLIRRDRNRPCIIAWELSLNETNFDSTYAGTAVGIGHAEYPGSQCYIAGWKFDSTYDIFIATPTAGARTYSGSKPLIIDEYGHWEYGGDGCASDVHRGNVGDKYFYGETAMLNQIVNHQDGHNLNRGMSNMCGDGLWVGIDYGPYPSGVLDPFRLPKFSYYFWQSQRDPNLIIPCIDSGPMVFIANYWTAGSPNDVRVYSNCEQVKLYVNDVLQGNRTPDTGYPTANLLHPPFTFSGLTFHAGELKAEGLINGEVVATHVVRTPGSAKSLSVEFDANDVPANGSETLFVYASILDANGTLVPTASNNVTFSVTGPASLASPATIKAEAGIATALVRVSDQPGLITVTAAASGLDGDSDTITSK
jgi:hypothetical protein